jgi:hypothetical protein
MKLVIRLFYGLVFSLLYVSPVFAAVPTSSDITNYTSDTLQIITLIGTASAVFFLIKGGYLYMTSTGNPEHITAAKKTIKNALIGLVIILGAGVIISTFQNALNNPASSNNSGAISLTPLVSTAPTGGLTQVLIDAVTGFMQNIVESATKPTVDAIMSFLTTTPNLMNNSVVFNFWLISLGIVDSLFVVVTALLGLHFMSASTFGFEEIELKQLLPRIGIAFLGANISLFLADYVIVTCNALVRAVLGATGGLNQAWVLNAINPATFITGTTPLITLIFLILFLIVSIVLLFMYITRLITISLGAVLSPFIFLLWVIPKTADFAEIAVKSYVVTVFIVFVHVVIIQLASSFLTIPGNTNNSLISIAVGIGLFFTLLKTPSFMMQMIMYSTGRGMMRKIGGQIINIITTDTPASVSRAVASSAIKLPRKAVSL